MTDPVPSDVAGTLLALLLRQMQRRAGTSLAAVAAGAAGRTGPDDVIVAHLVEHGRQLLPWLASARAAPVLADRTLRWVRGHNQFAVVDGAALEEQYSRGLRATAHLLRGAPSRRELVDGMQAAFRAHGAWLSGFVAEEVGPRPVEVVSSHYAPEVQLEALGRPALHSPLLDVGCGDGVLLDHLRTRGVDVTGLDIDGPAGALTGDWLTFNYGHRRWNTVISHLAFSLHFLHHELRRSDLAFTYGRAYVRILGSLRRGGTFAYVPSLPFVEAALEPSSWSITRHRVPFAEVDATHVRRR